MIDYHLKSKPDAPAIRLDASVLQPAGWLIEQLTTDDIAAITVQTDHRPRRLDELFDIDQTAINDPTRSDTPARLTIQPGPLVLDRLGAAGANARTGMAAGWIHVRGDAGDMIGHRMRRGTILIDGNVGTGCGATMTAGTIVVAGSFAHDAGLCLMDGSKRGTLVLSTKPNLPPDRFTRPVTTDAVWANLLSATCPASPVKDLLHRLATSGANTSRGDLANQGQCEILWPHP